MVKERRERKRERKKEITHEKKERKTKGIKNGKGVFSLFCFFPPSDSLKPFPQQGAKNTEKQG